jgi:hypothetical protein
MRYPRLLRPKLEVEPISGNEKSGLYDAKVLRKPKKVKGYNREKLLKVNKNRHYYNDYMRPKMRFLLRPDLSTDFHFCQRTT